MSTKLSPKNILYVSSDEYVKICDLHPKVRGRAKLVDCLIEVYGLNEKMKINFPERACKEELESFHTSEYVTCLESIESYFKENGNFNSKREEKICLDYSELMDEVECDIIAHGFGYDCEIFPDMLQYAKIVSGATLTAANSLMRKESNIAINLGGGWHHAHVDEAAGFCYVNDIVIGILHLLKSFKRILYIDFDVHHGDGVEEAFQFSNKVFTLSLHKYAHGFFPGTGDIVDVGKGSGTNFTCNIPLKNGIRDENYESVFCKVFDAVIRHFDPHLIVSQCGADMLNGDPLGGFNLTENCLPRCFKKIQAIGLPLLVLGGGGYHLPNTARCWLKLIASLLDVDVDDNIPEHEHLEKYGPDFSLEISPSNRKDENTIEYLNSMLEDVLENLSFSSADTEENNKENTNANVEVIDQEGCESEPVSKKNKIC
eukprot:TCONS_00063523-protein